MNARVARPLAGRRVVVTRAPEQAAEMLELLRERGAEPIVCSTIGIEAPTSYAELDAALRSIARYDWVAFTSANAVTSVAERASELGVTVPSTVHLAAVGKATARVLAERVRAADFVPTSTLANALATEIADIAGRRVLFPRGNLAGDTLGDTLRARGASVDEVVAYRTVPGPGAAELADLVHKRAVDAILFMSASSLRYLLDTMHARGEQLREGPAVICIGPETVRVASDAGIPVSAVAEEKTAEGVVEALERWYDREDDAERH